MLVSAIINPSENCFCNNIHLPSVVPSQTWKPQGILANVPAHKNCAGATWWKWKLAIQKGTLVCWFPVFWTFRKDSLDQIKRNQHLQTVSQHILQPASLYTTHSGCTALPGVFLAASSTIKPVYF